MTGMSNAPAPAPEPTPDPVTVTFSLPEDEYSHYLLADDDNDEATAMAKVNTEIMVESNTTASSRRCGLTTRPGLTWLPSGNNMPFTYVDWNACCRAPSLPVTRPSRCSGPTVGANQMMEPTGDVAYVTCGPFNCADGMDAPVPSLEDSAVCTAWDPTVDFQVGKVDNDVGSH